MKRTTLSINMIGNEKQKTWQKNTIFKSKMLKGLCPCYFNTCYFHILKKLHRRIIITIENNKKSPYYSFKYSNKIMSIRLPNLYYDYITPQTRIFLPILFSFLKVPPKWVQKLRNFIRYIKFALCLQTSFQTFLTHINFRILSLYI